MDQVAWLSGLFLGHEAIYGVGSEPACYDLFFVGENIAERIAGIEADGGTDASDHQPVLLTLTD